MCMDCTPTNLRSGKRMSALCVVALCVVSLLLAANNLGYSSPAPGQYAERLICIDSSAVEYPKIQFMKGHVHYQSFTGERQESSRKLSDGDTVLTGSDGFVSVKLSQNRYTNIQPFTLMKVDSSPNCSQPKSTSEIIYYGNNPFLSAVVRG